jgi:HPt (histidine-containing phosphotransfer) domain-containing protein
MAHRSYYDRARRTSRPFRRHVDLSKVKQIAPGCDGFCKELLTAFLNESSAWLRTIHEQFALANLPGVATCAHKFKPVGTYIGVSRLTDLMGRLEIAATRLEVNALGDLLKETNALISEINTEISGYLQDEPWRR